ncbi:MAG: hypothetical protein GXO91_06895 [FCB group bacterium]|nr:hypothetical protein [FCB group bacterium]
MGKIFFQLMFLCGYLLLGQDIFSEYLVEDGDTLDVFSYQVPTGYSEDSPAPLLVAFHHWGGNEMSNYSTNFDEEANQRGWLFLSPFGGAPNNYAHQGAQYFFRQEIVWMEENFAVDPNRIYMVGGSMGGAVGAIFANNHLDPTGPMVAATVSGSGILDCERRYYEMDGNNSMIQWFGGTPEEVPFEYHRNSAVYFADSTQSMHYNLQYTPLYLDFSANEPHRYHAEDLYNLLLGYNENMWIETNPGGGHGYSVLNDSAACDWMAQFELVSDPDNINVNLDESGRAYWLKAFGQTLGTDFIRILADRGDDSTFTVQQFANADSLLIFAESNVFETITVQNNPHDQYTLGLAVADTSQISFITVGGNPITNWSVDDNIIWIDGVTPGQYGYHFSTLPPDVNADGVWDVLDIVLTVNFIMGNAVPNDYQQIAADVNGDGVINILDIVTMINIIVG